MYRLEYKILQATKLLGENKECKNTNSHCNLNRITYACISVQTVRNQVISSWDTFRQINSIDSPEKLK